MTVEKYFVYSHETMGYCVMSREQTFVQQVSKWYKRQIYATKKAKELNDAYTKR